MIGIPRVHGVHVSKLGCETLTIPQSKTITNKTQYVRLPRLLVCICLRAAWNQCKWTLPSFIRDEACLASRRIAGVLPDSLSAIAHGGSHSHLKPWGKFRCHAIPLQIHPTRFLPTRAAARRLLRRREAGACFISTPSASNGYLWCNIITWPACLRLPQASRPPASVPAFPGPAPGLPRSSELSGLEPLQALSPSLHVAAACPAQHPLR
jgi:hypothetical protein